MAHNTALFIYRLMLIPDVEVWLLFVTVRTEVVFVCKRYFRIVRCMRAVAAKAFPLFSKRVSVCSAELFFFFLMALITERAVRCNDCERFGVEDRPVT